MTDTPAATIPPDIAALLVVGRHTEAVAVLRAAAALPGAPAAAWTLLARVLMAIGDPSDAFEAHREAIRRGDRSPETFMTATVAARAAGRIDAALQVARAALAGSRADWRLAHNLAVLLCEVRRLDEALAILEGLVAGRTPEAVPDVVISLLSDVAGRLKDAGRLDDALATYRRALAFRPDAAWLHSNLLLCLAYHPGTSPADLLAEHQAFGARFSRPFDPLAFPNDPDPDRQMRVGFVSPDLRRHVVAVVVEDFLAALDPGRIEVFCYANVAEPDDVTARIRSTVPNWRSIHDVPDDEVERLVRRDRIDVLIDLAGHTARNRLLLFARKPAPVQISWLGYPCTTGLPAIDYVATHLPAEAVVE
ncbi:MAG: tetratricopeptide repeat protein, partial [Rhodospirillales bacterium]